MCVSSPHFSFSLFPVRDVLRSPRFFSLARFRSALPSLLHWATLLYFIVMQRGHFYYDRANISRFQLAANAFIAEGVFASSPFPPIFQNTISFIYYKAVTLHERITCRMSNKNKSNKSKENNISNNKSISIDSSKINLNNQRSNPI